MTGDRRRFTRIPFDAPARLFQDDWMGQAQLVDISLRGLLVLQPETWDKVDPQQPVEAVIELGELEQVHMETRVAFTREGLVGLQCLHMDLNSLSHLKRLIVLNMGEEALDRELSALCS